jgi:hypothetical protein
MAAHATAANEDAVAAATTTAAEEHEEQVEDDRLLCVTKVVKGTEVTITGEFLSVSFPASRPNTSQVDHRGSVSNLGVVDDQEGDSPAAEAATAAAGAEAGSGGSYVRLKLQIVDNVEQLTASLTVGANALQKRVRKVFVERPDVFSPPIDGAENAYGEGEGESKGNVHHTSERDDASLLSEIPFNNNLQRLVFESVCENLDLFLSRQNRIMTVKYNAEG